MSVMRPSSCSRVRDKGIDVSAVPARTRSDAILHSKIKFNLHAHRQTRAEHAVHPPYTSKWPIAVVFRLR